MNTPETGAQSNAALVLAAAIEWLKNEGIYYAVKNNNQLLKVGKFNFYPKRSSIYVDKERGTRPEKGLQEFQALITTWRTGVRQNRAARAQKATLQVLSPTRSPSDNAH